MDTVYEQASNVSTMRVRQEYCTYSLKAVYRHALFFASESRLLTT